jgi:Uma2 family endonuclease
MVMRMATTATKQQPTEIIYPDSDGKPMADNTLQADAMTIIYNNLRAIFADDPNVFVAMDLLWYPVEGNPRIRVAPDVLVALGRPKGHRGSYKQWEEGGVAPQVVFEVLSPGNRTAAMNAKRRFYARYGVQEYYVYDPDTGLWQGWVRRGRRLTRVRQMEGWRSPLLGIVFGKGFKENPGLRRPDGSAFIAFEALARMAELAERRAERERQMAERFRQQMLEAQRRAEREARLAQQEQRRAERERLRAEQERQRAEQLAQRLRELGIDPDTLE